MADLIVAVDTETSLRRQVIETNVTLCDDNGVYSLSIDYKIDQALLQPVIWGEYIQKYAANMTVYVFVESLFVHIQDIISPMAFVLKLTNKSNKQNTIQLVKSYTRPEEDEEEKEPPIRHAKKLKIRENKPVRREP